MKQTKEWDLSEVLKEIKLLKKEKNFITSIPLKDFETIKKNELASTINHKESITS
jgi:hypothetical protein